MKSTKSESNAFLPVDSLLPNDYNPNRMADAAFSELVAEVRHLGRVAKPVVVRPQGDAYVIVDGEHSWRAAKETGLKEVLCEIVEVDDFEARRQTLKRNQHGEHNPVLLGQMFRQMMALRGVSQRALAKEIDVSEGTVRNALVYAEGLDLRNRYAPDRDHREEIEALSVRHVRRYVELPQPVGDLWLDSGADLEELGKAMSCTVDSNAKRQVMEFEAECLKDLAGTGFLEAVHPGSFVEGMHAAWRLWWWREQHKRLIEDLDQYLPPVVRVLRLWSVNPEELLDSFLPCRRGEPKSQVLLSPEKWAAILDACSQKAKKFGDLEEMVRASLRLELNVVGQLDLTDPRDLELHEKLKTAPDFIRNADISLFDKVVLANIDGGGKTPEDVALVLDAKRQTIEALKSIAEAKRTIKQMIEKETDVRVQMQLAMTSTDLRKDDVSTVFNEELEKLVRGRELAERNALLESDDNLLDAAVAAMEKLHNFRERRDKPILRARLAGLPWPERRFLCALIVGHQDVAMSCWLRSVDPEWCHADAPETPKGSRLEDVLECAEEER